MWTKTINLQFKGVKTQVQIWLSDTKDKNEVVTIQSMVNEYFLIEKVKLPTRDAAHDFIKYFPVTMAKAFLIREGYSSGAIN